MKIHTPVFVVALLLSVLSAEAFAQFPGNTNRSRKFRSVIAGGAGNLIWSNTLAATISGGYGNFANGFYATIPGGLNCKANHRGSFVWGAVDGVLTESFQTNSFTVRAPGGVRFISTTNSDFSGDNTNNGVFLAPGGNSWAALSDSNTKTAIKPIDRRVILRKLADLPVTEWQYKGQPERNYIGPMAQDFHAVFGLGYDDKTISTADTDGVMYAAIQGLVEELKERDKAMAARDETIEELKSKLQAVEERLNSLPPAP